MLSNYWVEPGAAWVERPWTEPRGAAAPPPPPPEPVHHSCSVSSAPSSSSDFLIYVGRRNIQPRSGTTFAENNPIAFYFCAMFYCYFRFVLVYKSGLISVYFFPAQDDVWLRWGDFMK